MSSRTTVIGEELGGILRLLAKEPMPGYEDFATAQLFVIGESQGVSVSFIHNSFRKDLLGRNLVPERIPPGILKVYENMRSVRDSQVIHTLGGPASCPNNVGALWSLLKLQPRGQTGLLSLQKANVLYVPPRRGQEKLRAIAAVWSTKMGGWCFASDSVNRRDSLSPGCHILCR